MVNYVGYVIHTCKLQKVYYILQTFELCTSNWIYKEEIFMFQKKVCHKGVWFKAYFLISYLVYVCDIWVGLMDCHKICHGTETCSRRKKKLIFLFFNPNHKRIGLYRELHINNCARAITNVSEQLWLYKMYRARWWLMTTK